MSITAPANRKSKISLLPEEIKQQLNVLIRSGNMMQKDILAAVHEMIDEAGLGEEAKPSRTSFNRYAKRMENMGARIRQAREVAEVWTAKLGDAPTSELGKLLQEFVRTMAFETSSHMMEQSEEKQEPIPPKALAQLALVIQRIEQSSMVSHKVEQEVRKAYAKEMESKVDKVAKASGWTADTVAEIKQEFFGIGPINE
ncbi:DUF3486 family protein [Aliivibrio wodanis]|uniref:DUF3486 family protein n=1 Tax=Aliivibrio wodanis TaxID=80852 RepID=UPI00406CD3F3